MSSRVPCIIIHHVRVRIQINYPSSDFLVQGYRLAFYSARSPFSLVGCTTLFRRLLLHISFLHLAEAAYMARFTVNWRPFMFSFRSIPLNYNYFLVSCHVPCTVSVQVRRIKYKKNKFNTCDKLLNVYDNWGNIFLGSNVYKWLCQII